jgi:hypothetical protein
MPVASVKNNGGKVDDVVAVVERDRRRARRDASCCKWRFSRSNADVGIMGTLLLLTETREGDWR